MRVSANLGDVGYSAYMAKRPLLVFLDGVKVERCVAADDEEGWAESHVVGEDGRFVLDGDTIRTERRTGKVEIIPFGHSL